MHATAPHREAARDAHAPHGAGVQRHGQVGRVLLDAAEVPLGRALAIGFCQTISMIPGVSRAGATIMGGLVMGLDRRAAAEFSFFLAIPTMLGAGLLDLVKYHSQIDGALALDIAVASLAAFVTAIIVVRAFISFITRHTFEAFGWYRIVAGLAMLGYLALR